LIDGGLTPGVGTFDIVNPASGESFAQCPKADLAQLNQAVAAAKAAFPGRAATPVDDRAALVGKLAEAFAPRIDEFARPYVVNALAMSWKCVKVV
jgi:acyl-CoA reductase-like NAD-dependent aldehyde dehydrogenase